MNETFFSMFVAAILSVAFFFIGKFSRSKNNDNARDRSGIENDLDETAFKIRADNEQLGKCVSGSERLRDGLHELQSEIEIAGERIGDTQARIDEIRAELSSIPEEFGRIEQLLEELSERAKQ